MPPNEAIGPPNFRQCAQRAIEQYQRTGQVIDALVWSTIIGLYERTIEEYERRLALLPVVPSKDPT